MHHLLVPINVEPSTPIALSFRILQDPGELELEVLGIKHHSSSVGLGLPMLEEVAKLMNQIPKSTLESPPRLLEGCECSILCN